MLPGESEFKETLERELDFELKFGRSFLNCCTSIITDRNPAKQPAEDEVIAYQIGHALCIKACKTYRSILLLSSIGASSDVDTLARTMLETAIATLFILKPQVTLGIDGFADDQLTSERRARIYAAFPPIRKYRDFLRHSKDERFVGAISSVDVDRLRKSASDAETDIGEFWAARVASWPHTYSGFNIRVLVEKLDPDLSRFYAGVYWLQSKPVHAVDAADHVAIGARDQMVAKWQSSPNDVRGDLIVAGVLLWRCIAELDSRFEFANSPDDPEMTTKFELQLALAVLDRFQQQWQPRLNPATDPQTSTA
jgi:hypothetical protein